MSIFSIFEDFFGFKGYKDWGLRTMHFCCRKAKNSCFAPKTLICGILSRMSRNTQHTRFEDKFWENLLMQTSRKLCNPGSEEGALCRRRHQSVLKAATIVYYCQKMEMILTILYFINILYVHFLVVGWPPYPDHTIFSSSSVTLAALSWHLSVSFKLIALSQTDHPHSNWSECLWWKTNIERPPYWAKL